MRAAWCLLLPGLFACAHPADSGAAPPASTGVSAGLYFPLAVGNRWSYRASGESGDAVEVVEIRGVKDGQYSDSKGRLLWVSSDGLRDQSRVILRSPVEAGRSWTVVLGPDSVEHWRINSVGTPCKVPAGSFSDCVEVESRISPAAGVELLNRLTFAAGVGIVKIRTTLLRKGVEVPQTELLLTAYQVAPLRARPAG